MHDHVPPGWEGFIMSSNTRAFRIALAAVIGLGWAACAWSQTTSAPAKEYEIKMFRPVKVDQVFRLSASGRDMRQQRHIPGTPPKKDELVFEVRGLLRVLEINKTGQPTKVSLILDSCIKIEGSERNEQVAQGTEVIISGFGGGKNIQATDRNRLVSPEVERMLDVVVDLPITPGTDDDLFGTAKPQRIGDSWPVHSEIIADSLGMLAAIKKEDVTGQTKLAGLAKVEGIECLAVHTETKIKNCAPAAGPGATVLQAELTATQQVNVPLDPSMPMLGGTQKACNTVMMRLKQASGPDLTIEVKHEREFTETVIPVSK
jgi:hypothetical protein